MDYLPAAVYSSPPRQARGRQLNTILERDEESSTGNGSGSETEHSDSTIYGRPAAWDTKCFVAAPKHSRLNTTTFPPSPASDIASSPCSSTDEYGHRVSTLSSCDGSDTGTLFSDSCPSLGTSEASDPTSFATNSSRNSLSSRGSGRNRYPAILIPDRDSWHSRDGIGSPFKNSPQPKTPINKIGLSPAVLSALPQWVPAIHAPPSFGDDSSVTSESSSVPGLSAPVTPDLRNLHIIDAEGWEPHHGPDPHHQESELIHDIVVDDDVESGDLAPSIPSARQSRRVVNRASSQWSDIVVQFPAIPGATPQEVTPITPNMAQQITFPRIEAAAAAAQAQLELENGVQLPPDALRTLDMLQGRTSPDTHSDASGATGQRGRTEMQELGIPRPKSADGATPASDYSSYSFSQLSIPSPGGFFASLQAGSRNTWCPGAANPPSSTTAENFYNTPWQAPERIVQTTLQVVDDDDATTEGLPTARQDQFTGITRKSSDSEVTVVCDDDLYGEVVPVSKGSTSKDIRYEYEEAYEDELKVAAEAHLDRTSTWLSAQTSYMSALRESNPVNDVNDPTTPANQLSQRVDSEILDSPMRKAISFLEDAAKSSLASPVPTITVTPTLQINANGSPDLKQTSSPKSPTIRQAFDHIRTQRKRRDAFLHAAARLSFVDSLRIALPETHMANLIGSHTLTGPERPKYSGPFSQNPRQTGVFKLTTAQSAFRAVEREQLALKQIQPASWSVEALKYLYGGRLFASSAACAHLSSKATTPLSDPNCLGRKRIRVLDLGGQPTADWSWHVAAKWPNVKVYTVMQKAQSTLNDMYSSTEGPDNHRVVTVPHLWQLPFRDNHFDVISARSLHSLLKAEPVAGVKQIDEFELTLRECMRILKPGGRLEWLIMDSTIAKAGPLGEKVSVEFGFRLKQRGYEREITNKWLARIDRAGFRDVKRAHLFLPMGRHSSDGGPHVTSARDGGRTWKDAPRPISEVSDVGKIVNEYLGVEAVQGPVGSTGDVADLAGLLGGWMWESWLVKLGLEMGRDRERLLDGVAAVIDEGRERGAGWRVMSGWARKPKLRNLDKVELRSSLGTIEFKIEE